MQEREGGNESHSVSGWIEDLKQGSESAAENVWERYFPSVVRVANQQLGNAPRRVEDEEDVALKVFKSLFDGASKGQFEQLANRRDLWNLLVAITRKKSANQIRFLAAKKRGGANIDEFEKILSSNGYVEPEAPESDPEIKLELKEHLEFLMSMLEDDCHREVASNRLLGKTNQEIAELIGISVRSVERKLQRVRVRWVEFLD